MATATGLPDAAREAPGADLPCVPRGVAVRRRLTVRGTVQGVGFRPFVHGLAIEGGLSGSVRNTSGAVVVEVQGDAPAIETFCRALQSRPPRLARITSVEVAELTPAEGRGFVIEESRAVPGEYQPLAPDAATCPDCVRELFDARDRRHRHPFINCTGCGPRFTIIDDVPYDRSRTTMRGFAMCCSCRTEYDDPADRRFHAQPNCCPDCGPRLRFRTTGDATAPPVTGDAATVAAAVAALRAGRIVAVKGLGGFQLACVAADDAAVDRLRRRKRRPAKPFAVMVADVAAARDFCAVSAAEATLLDDPARPIVLLRRSTTAGPVPVAAGVTPGLDEVGVMLPATPLHHLLLHDIGAPLVMTSGNVSEEPIARDDREALERLAGIADAFVLHDREIHARYDDSVARVVAGAARLVRRARGYCPSPIPLGDRGADVLALGAHLKNTFCVVHDGNAFVGPHIGDLDGTLTLDHHAEALSTYLHLFRVRPRAVACDLHPDLASSRLAERWWDGGARPVRVQHHHAHVASVMAEHGLRGRLLGVALDGLGLGPDGTLWGGEWLLCDEARAERVGHLAPVRQPGGDLAAREGWRMAVAFLVAAGIPVDAAMASRSAAYDSRRLRLVARVAGSDDLAPLTTSCGRWFDAVAALLGVADLSTFEAEAPMRLEALARTVPEVDVAGLALAMDGSPLVLDTVGLVRGLVAQRDAGRPAAELAAAAHECLARGVAAATARLCADRGVNRVALSGGVFQNGLLLERTVELLRGCALDVYVNALVPANDGGISLGQALVAGAVLDRDAA